MNKNMLSQEVAVQEKITLTTAFKTVDAIVRIISQTLVKGEPVVLRGFGTFLVVDKPERTIRDIKTGEPVIVPAHKSVIFRPSKNIVEPLNATDEL